MNANIFQELGALHHQLGQDGCSSQCLHVQDASEQNKIEIKLASTTVFQPLGIPPRSLDLRSKSDWFDNRIEE